MGEPAGVKLMTRGGHSPSPNPINLSGSESPTLPQPTKDGTEPDAPTQGCRPQVPGNPQLSTCLALSKWRLLPLLLL